MLNVATKSTGSGDSHALCTNRRVRRGGHDQAFSLSLSLSCVAISTPTRLRRTPPRLSSFYFASLRISSRRSPPVTCHRAFSHNRPRSSPRVQSQSHKRPSRGYPAAAFGDVRPTANGAPEDFFGQIARARASNRATVAVHANTAFGLYLGVFPSRAPQKSSFTIYKRVKVHLYSIFFYFLNLRAFDISKYSRVLDHSKNPVFEFHVI